MSDAPPRGRPRTASHVPLDAPAPRDPPGGRSGAEDRPTGRPGGQGEPVVAAVGNDGRAADGKFLPQNAAGRRFGPGNHHGKGSPNSRRMYELREQFLGAIDPGTIPALARRLQVEALQGDMDATKMLLDWCLGKPSQALELSGPDGEPLGLSVGAVTAVVLGALDGPEHLEARVALARRFRELADDARRDA